MCSSDLGLSRDLRLATQYLRSSAEHDNAQAQFEWGWTMFSGKSGQREAKQGLEWIRKAANQGFPAAQFNLGVAYDKGEGVERDPIEAGKWILLSEKGGYFATAGVGAEMKRKTTPERFEAIEKLASAFVPKLIRQTPYVAAPPRQPVTDAEQSVQ